MYHRTDPQSAARLRSGEKIRSGGLSFFTDPNMAARYEGELSAGTVHPGAPTVTGKTPSSNAIPDLEWHPDAYTKIFKDIADKMKADPTYRPPSLQTTSSDPDTKQLKWQKTIPGAVAVTDPSGVKRIEPGWRPTFTTNSSGKVVPQIEPHASNKQVHINYDPKMVAMRGAIEKYPIQTIEWGGRASIPSLSGFPEQQQLHTLTTKSGIKKMTSDFIKNPSVSDAGLKGFRTIAPGNVKIDNPTLLKVGGNSLKGLGVAGAIADPAGTAFQTAADAVGGRFAGALGGGLGAALFINQSAGDPEGDIVANMTPEQTKEYNERKRQEMLARQEQERRQKEIDRMNAPIRNPQMGGPVNKPKM